MNSFSERLLHILAGRQKHPWGAALGIPKGVVTTMFRNVVPRASTLAAIQHAENARVDWLLTGQGVPFLVETYSRTRDELKRLALGLRDEPGDWSVTIVHDGAAAAAVLTQPGEYEADEVKFAHVIVEVLAGPASAAELAVCVREAPHANLRCLRVSRQQLAALCTGQMGTWALLGDPDHPGLLARTPDDELPGAELKLVAEVQPIYSPQGASPHDDGGERWLLERFRSLSERRQSALLDLLDDDEPKAGG